MAVSEDRFDEFEVTPIEYYHLLKRTAATLTIWNARNLNMPSDLKPIELKGLNPFFKAYDRDCCVVVAPVNLFDGRRTEGHALEAAHVLACYAITEMGWDKIELTGLDTMVRRGLVTGIVLEASILRATVTDKEQKLAEAIKKAQPSWAKPLMAPRQGGQ